MSDRSIFKPILGILLLLAGIAGIVMTVILTISRSNAVNVSVSMTAASDVLLVVASLINIVCAIIFLSRNIPRKALKVRPFIQVSAIIGIIQILVSSTNGIMLDHLFICIGILVFIPELFFITIGPVLRR